MATDPSIKQIRTQWVLAIAMWAMLLVALVAAMLRGQYVMAIAIPAVALLIFGKRQLVVRKQRFLLRARTSEALATFYRRLINEKVPHADALRAYSCAVTAACYGEFDRAEALMESVDWRGRGGVYEAMPLYVEALLLYWRDRAYQRGLAVALNARTLGDVARGLPGFGSSRLAYDLLVGIGDVLSGSGDADTLEALTLARQKLPLMSRLLAMWALAVARSRSGDTAEAEALLGQVRAVAPYCRSLLEIPG
jgi:hypothetical protein